MKFTIPSADFRALLSKLSHLPGGKTSPSIAMKAVEFGGIELRRSTEVANLCVKDMDALVSLEGNCDVNYQALSAFIGRLPSGNVSVIHSQEASTLILKQGAAERTLRCYPSGVVREIPEPSGVKIEMPAEALITSIETCKRAAIRGGRENLMGVCFRVQRDRFSMFGSDGKRLHLIWGRPLSTHLAEENGRDAGRLIDLDCCQAIKQVMDGEKGAIVCTFGKTIDFSASAGSARFAVNSNVAPNIDPFITHDNPDWTITIDKEKLSRAVKLAQTCSGVSNSITMQGTFGGVVISSSDDGDSFSEIIECQGTAEGVGFIINSTFLTDAIESTPGASIEMSYLEKFRAVRIENESQYILIVTMYRP